MQRLKLVSWLLILILFAYGCQIKPEKVEQKKPKKENRKVNKAASPLPAKFPKEVPIYTKGQIITTANADTNWKLAITTPASGDQIFGWYFDQLTAKNWQVTLSFYDVAKNYGAIKATQGPLQIQVDIRPSLKNNQLAGTEATLTVSKQ